MYKVVLAVTNDIITDNRVHKIAGSLQQNGYSVTVVGRRFRNSKNLFGRKYETRRFTMLFNSGPLFYLGFNIRLFFYLLKTNPDIMVANDLDTLLASYLGARIKRKSLVLDSHELFTEIPELVERKAVKGIWKLLEKNLVPRVKMGYTVSEAIALFYKEKYKVEYPVVKNVGLFKYEYDFNSAVSTYSDKIIIYQGFLNIGRGLELIIKSMAYLDDCQLWILGSGDIEVKLKKLVAKLRLRDKVQFFGRKPLEDLWEYTQKASLGISMEEDLGLNYRYALPNKLFDYIQARIPVLVSDLPEMSRIVKEFQIGSVVEKREPESIARQIKDLIFNEEDHPNLKKNLELAARELCWQREEDKLLEIYRKVIELKDKRIS